MSLQSTPIIAEPLIELRGPSGRLYGLLNVRLMIIEFKRGREEERIDLTPYLEQAKIKGEDYHKR